MEVQAGKTTSKNLHLHFKIQREGERTFHFSHTLKSQSQLFVCLLAPTLLLYMIKNVSLLPQNDKNSVEFRRIQEYTEM